MSYAKEDLEDLYKIFGNIEKLREFIIGDPNQVRDNNIKGMLQILDEVIKLRAEVEKLKIQNRG